MQYQYDALRKVKCWQTNPSSCTNRKGISASTSISVDMDDGRASYVGAAGVGAAEGAGREAARAAAIEGAAITILSRVKVVRRTQRALRKICTGKECTRDLCALELVWRHHPSFDCQTKFSLFCFSHHSSDLINFHATLSRTSRNDYHSRN